MRIVHCALGALLASAVLIGCGEREAARTASSHDRRTDAAFVPEADSAPDPAAGTNAQPAGERAPDEPAEAAAVEMTDPAGIARFDAKGGRTAGRSLSVEGRPGIRGRYANPIPNRNNPNFDTEAYDHISENDFIAVRDEALSTFSIDVDTASYANVRRFLNNNNLPPAGAVRIEELINYFPYDYEPPAADGPPFAVHVEMAQCPWNPEHELARIALKGREIDFADRPPVNLVFLLDVSGSMRRANKLPYVQESMRLLVDKLGENDQVTTVVYAGNEGLALPTTTADHREVILTAIDQLQAGGSTNGGAGIQLAYDKAVENFIEGGVNRVILCTDGDFNVGVTSQSELVNLIERKAKSDVFLSVLGFGMGNYKDSTMEKLADKGNGNYAYIDTLSEARKVLVEQITGTLITIAKDVKIQVDFNPAQIAAYRLIGYENRMLAAQDFKDDAKDAGEIGAGHTVTALYELVPPGVPNPAGEVEPSIYQTPAKPDQESDDNEVFTVRLRYKLPDADKSTLRLVAVERHDQEFDQASVDFRFAAAVAQFGMLLRDSEYAPKATWSNTRQIAAKSLGDDEDGYRAEFIRLVQEAAVLNGEERAVRETARR